MTASPTSIMGQFEQDEKMFAQEPAVVDFQQPEGGTPFGKLFQCCFPKEEKRTALPKQVEPEVESRGLSIDPDVSESGMVYFDLPDIDEEESSPTSTPSSLQGPGIVMEFWKLFFSVFLLNWLPANDNKKRIAQK